VVRIPSEKQSKSQEIKDIEDNIYFIIKCMNTLTEVIKNDQKTIQQLIEKIESLESPETNDTMYL